MMARKKFDEKLRELNKEMTRMGELVEDAIQKATTALFAQDVVAAREIMAGDEEVNAEKKAIENMCFSLLLHQQPVARDLRMITSAMKMVTDIERIGDHAADISELTILMSGDTYHIDDTNIRKMVSETLIMLLHAVEAYVERDVVKAKEVIERDDIVDELFLVVKQDLISVIQKDPQYGEQAADFLLVNKYLERIGDHATNIAEWVIFALEEK